MVAISKRQNSAWTWLLWHTGGDNMTPSATSCRNTAVNSSRSPAATWQGQSHNTNSQGILQQKAALRHQLFVLQHICCAVLCCAVLCCAVLCCAVLCCAVLCCALLFCLGCAVSCCAAKHIWAHAPFVWPHDRYQAGHAIHKVD